MAFLNFRVWLGYSLPAHTGYHRGRSAKQNSIAVFFAITLLHLVLIVIAINSTLKQSGAVSTPSFKMIYLSQEKPPVPTELSTPIIESTSIKTSMVLPEIVIEEPPPMTLTLDRSLSNYPLLNPNDAKYRGVFDPKMRQKLSDAQHINRPKAKEKSNSWTAADGRVYIDMGDGNCMVSMQKMDSRERGTNWGGTRCGKNNSEKMMDNVMADFESRKHLLKTQ